MRVLYHMSYSFNINKQIGCPRTGNLWLFRETSLYSEVLNAITNLLFVGREKRIIKWENISI